MLLDTLHGLRSLQVLQSGAAFTADQNSKSVQRLLDVSPLNVIVANSVDGVASKSINFEFVVNNGGDTWSGTVFVLLKLQESDDSTDGSNGTWTDVTQDMGLMIQDRDSALVDSSKQLKLTDSTNHDNKNYMLGYRGDAKFVRAVIDLNGTHTNGTIMSINAIIEPKDTPV